MYPDLDILKKTIGAGRYAVFSRYFSLFFFFICISILSAFPCNDKNACLYHNII